MNENSLTAKTWKYAAMTQAGAVSLANTMQKKFGCKILRTPQKLKNEMWEFEFTNPLRTNKWKTEQTE